MWERGRKICSAFLTIRDREVKRDLNCTRTYGNFRKELSKCACKTIKTCFFPYLSRTKSKKNQHFQSPVNVDNSLRNFSWVQTRNEKDFIYDIVRQSLTDPYDIFQLSDWIRCRSHLSIHPLFFSPMGNYKTTNNDIWQVLSPFSSFSLGARERECCRMNMNPYWKLYSYRILSLVISRRNTIFFALHENYKNNTTKCHIWCCGFSIGSSFTSFIVDKCLNKNRAEL